MGPFKFVIMAIAAGMLLYIAMAFFAPPDDSNIGKMKAALDYAEHNEGKLNEVELALREGFATKGGSLDTAGRNVRFRCASPETCMNKGLILDERVISIKTKTIIPAFFRCIKKGTINDCAIYFGEKPAQLQIGNMESQFPEAKGGTAKLSFSMRNIGSLNSVNPEWGIKLYKKISGNGTEKFELRGELTGKVQKIAPDKSEEITKEIEIMEEGSYKIVAAAQGEDSGMDSWEGTFETAGGISQSCTATYEDRPLLDNGVCRAKHNCSGCEFGYECKIRWLEKGIIESETTEIFPSAVYTEKPANEGKCG